jgi:hypothetical protein
MLTPLFNLVNRAVGVWFDNSGGVIIFELELDSLRGNHIALKEKGGSHDRKKGAKRWRETLFHRGYWQGEIDP